jgi:hypothetical protein
MTQLSKGKRVAWVIAMFVCLVIIGSFQIARQPGGSLGLTVAVPMDTHCLLGIFCWNDNEPSVGGGEFHPAQEPQPRKVTPEKHCPPFSSPDWEPFCHDSSGYGHEPYGVEPAPAHTEYPPLFGPPPKRMPNMEGYGPNQRAEDRQNEALRTYCKDFPNSPDCH